MRVGEIHAAAVGREVDAVRNVDVAAHLAQRAVEVEAVERPDRLETPRLVHGGEPQPPGGIGLAVVDAREHLVRLDRDQPLAEPCGPTEGIEAVLQAEQQTAAPAPGDHAGHARQVVTLRSPAIRRESEQALALDVDPPEKRRWPRPSTALRR